MEGTASSALSAIAQVGSILELIPTTCDAEAHLKRLVPDYEEEGNSSPEDLEALSSVSKQEIFAEIPAPDSQIENAWRRLCCFEAYGRCYRPSDRLLLTAWIQLLEYSTIKGLSLNRTKSGRVKELLVDDEAYTDAPLRNLLLEISAVAEFLGG